MIFWLSSFCGKSTNKNLYSEKTFFSYLMNWDLGHLQSSVDENKIAIRKISIRSIRKLSYFDQQTIVGGPHFNLTNGEISIIFPLFCKIHFSNNFIILLQFWLIFQLFQPLYAGSILNPKASLVPPPTSKTRSDATIHPRYDKYVQILYIPLKWQEDRFTLPTITNRQFIKCRRVNSGLYGSARRMIPVLLIDSRTRNHTH